MKSKHAKHLMLGCIKVNKLDEVSWVTGVSIQGRVSDLGSVKVFSEYLGDLDDCISEIKRYTDRLNFSHKDKKVYE